MPAKKLLKNVEKIFYLLYNNTMIVMTVLYPVGEPWRRSFAELRVLAEQGIGSQ